MAPTATSHQVPTLGETLCDKRRVLLELSASEDLGQRGQLTMWEGHLFGPPCTGHTLAGGFKPSLPRALTLHLSA